LTLSHAYISGRLHHKSYTAKIYLAGCVGVGECAVCSVYARAKTLHWLCWDKKTCFERDTEPAWPQAFVAVCRWRGVPGRSMTASAAH